MENKEIYVSAICGMLARSHIIQMTMCVLSSCCTSIVTEIKLALQCKEGMKSGMQATISCLHTATSSDFTCVQRAEGNLRSDLSVACICAR